MRMLRYSYLLCALLISCSAAHAQSGGPAGEAPGASPGKQPTAGEAEARGRAWFDQCMQDWDKETHMSKQEWERTCRRMARERVKFLMDQVK